MPAAAAATEPVTGTDSWEVCAHADALRTNKSSLYMNLGASLAHVPFHLLARIGEAHLNVSKSLVPR